MGGRDQVQVLEVEGEGVGRAVRLRVDVPRGQPDHPAVVHVFVAFPRSAVGDGMRQLGRAIAVDADPGSAFAIALYTHPHQVGDVDPALDRRVDGQAAPRVFGTAPVRMAQGDVDAQVLATGPGA